jgi:hypothetical protein
LGHCVAEILLAGGLSSASGLAAGSDYRSSVGCRNKGNDPTARIGGSRLRSKLDAREPFGNRTRPDGTAGKSYKITGISTLMRGLCGSYGSHFGVREELVYTLLDGVVPVVGGWQDFALAADPADLDGRSLMGTDGKRARLQQ